MNILSKILNTVKHYQKDIFLGVCIVLISIIGFNLGRINATNKTPPAIGEGSRWKVESSNQKANLTKTIDNSQSSTFNSQKSDPRVVASKASSSKKYHYSWCASGKRITQKNKLWFENESLAQKAGYTLAGNCTN